MPPPYTADTVLYVVTIHGMGEQKQHETSLPLVNRFAEARGRNDVRPICPESPWYVANREGLMGATGLPVNPDDLFTADLNRGTLPWVELTGLDLIPPVVEKSPAQGKAEAAARRAEQVETRAEKRAREQAQAEAERARKAQAKARAGKWVDPTTAGTHMRFTDVLWADIMQERFPIAASSLEAWASSMMFRLVNKQSPRTPYHIRKLMEVLVGTLTLTSRVLGYRFTGLRRLMFDHYLGDVQLYAEYAESRGLAVRRFHEWMTRLEFMHYQTEQARVQKDPALTPREPRYLILAHSLGTVLTVDALFAAALPPSIRCDSQADLGNWPWAGYRNGRSPGDQFVADVERLRTQWKAQPSLATWTALVAKWQICRHYDTHWISRVDRLVTFGSPVDKFLALFWDNYRYLVEPAEGAARWEHIATSKHRIVHDNYCDEQDMVGGHLDILETTSAYHAVFQTDPQAGKGEDVLYAFNAVPGLAHVTYFNHPELWQRVIDRAIDTRQPDQPVLSLTRPAVYPWVLFYSYLLWPMLGTAGLYYAYRVISSPTHGIHSLEWQKGLVGGIVLGALVLGYGRRLIELTMWWRQILRAERKNHLDSAGFAIFEHSEAAFRYALLLVPIGCLFVLMGFDFQGWALAMENAKVMQALQAAAPYLAGVTVTLLGIAAYYHFCLPGVKRLERLFNLLLHDGLPLLLLASALAVGLFFPPPDPWNKVFYWSGVGLELFALLWVLFTSLILPKKLQHDRLCSLSQAAQADSATPRPRAESAVRQPTDQHANKQFKDTLRGVFTLAVAAVGIAVLLGDRLRTPWQFSLDQRAAVAIAVYLFMTWTVAKFWDIKGRIWKKQDEESKSIAAPTPGYFAHYAGFPLRPQRPAPPPEQAAAEERAADVAT